MTGRPSGTVTFLFTDIEGSTRLWQAHPEAMAEALERHDVILRAAIGAADGHVFSTAGDAFAAAFDRAGAAVEAAIAAQRLLQAEAWPGGVVLKARMGIHTGEAVERDGDYFGPTLNRGARVMSVAHGGQVLVTGTAVGVLDGSGVTLVDLGEHVLRDIDGAEHLFQVAATGLSAAFPPVRTVGSAHSSLPSQRSSFVGRDAEIARARALLGSGRLVTLTGAGGCGKTRLAIEVAAREVYGFKDGAFFVDLARIGSDDEVAEAFATAIDFAPEPGRAVDEQVRSRIGSKQMLLVVDNCEHVLDEVAAQVDALLAACRNVRIVATSREALDVDGESALRVPSMSVETTEGRPAAALLFLERVAESGGVVDPGDDDVIVEICRRLDGLPLAIELAAARAGVLSPAQILERLDDRFTLLTGGRRRTRGRQQTLETTIAWSYDLLDTDEQDALRRISVMPAAFDLDLAAAVLACTSTTALDLLESLTSRSLLHTIRDGRSPQLRYRLLETIRAYAHDRLVDHGDADATRDRHGRRIVARLDAAATMPMSMRPEHRLLADDALAAIDWAHATGDTTLGAQLVCAASTIYIARGLFDKGIAVFEWAATVDDPVMRSRVYAVCAILVMASGRGSVSRFANLSLRAAGDLPVPWRAAMHGVRLVFSVLVDTDSFAEDLRLGRAAGSLPNADQQNQRTLDLFEADWLIWHGDHKAAISILERAGWFPDLEPLSAMNLHGACLLAHLLARDSAAIAAHLRDPAVAPLRAGWIESVRRGEHWLISYEAIRAACVGFLGDHDQARHDLCDVIAALDIDRMPGVDADLLGGFAWICIGAGEVDRAVELLDDTWSIARSPNTSILLIAAEQRGRGIDDNDLSIAGSGEIIRRFMMSDVIAREQRTRNMLNSELARLGRTS